MPDFSASERESGLSQIYPPLPERLARQTSAVGIYFMHRNFVRIHQTLHCTPAMTAGATMKLWELADTVKVLGDWERRKSNLL